MRKHKITAILLIAVLALSAVLLSACGGKEPETLEEYVAQNQSLKDQIAQTAADSDLEIAVSGNDIAYTFTYEDELKDDELELNAQTLEEALTSQKDVFNGLAASLEEETGLTGITVTLVYKDAGGKLIYSATYPME